MCVYVEGDTNPSTSPLFFPRCANSGCSSTPANMPFLPGMVPMKRTVPCMLPGTWTLSPTPRSSTGGTPALGVKGAGAILLVWVGMLFREVKA